LDVNTIFTILGYVECVLVATYVWCHTCATFVALVALLFKALHFCGVTAQQEMKMKFSFYIECLYFIRQGVRIALNPFTFTVCVLSPPDPFQAGENAQLD
jgi:hypothetical protein